MTPKVTPYALQDHHPGRFREATRKELTHATNE